MGQTTSDPKLAFFETTESVTLSTPKPRDSRSRAQAEDTALLARPPAPGFAGDVSLAMLWSDMVTQTIQERGEMNQNEFEIKIWESESQNTKAKNTLHEQCS